MVTYVRDNQGRTTQIRVNDSLRQTFGYDSLSRMILATDNNAGRMTHTVTFDYNDLSRPEKEIQDSYTLFRQFDANGNKTKITYPSARVVDKAYDENNMLTDISFQGNVAAQATYDKNSRLAYASFGNGADLSLSYDAARGRENDRSVTTPSADPLFRVSGMGCDGQGNITDRIETFNGTAVDEELAFDHLDRLVSWTRGAAPAVTWEYDKVGNWEHTNQNGAYETRTVTDDNEYALIDTLFPVHDNRGNMTFDGVQAYAYDWANRLVKVSSGPQTLAEYTYDALNRRVTKTTSTAATTYVYDGGDVVEEYTGGTLVRAFAFGAAIDDPILMEYNGQTYYYAKDTLGSIRAITDANGLLVESYDYGPFGLMTIFDGSGQDITATGSTVGNPYGFTGRRWDGESGLWYYRNRMYSAELGRFLQRDPAGYVDGLNLYAYVLNNPLRYTDPNGLAVKATAQVAYDTVKFANDYIAAPLVNPVLYNVVAPTINQFNSLVETGIDFSNKYIGTTDQDLAAFGPFLDAATGMGFKSASIAVGILASTSKLKKISTVASKSVKEFDVVPYRPTNSPLVNHHGVNDVWAKNNILGYVSRIADNPTIALSVTGHKAAHKTGNDYLKETVGSVRGQAKNLSFRQMQEMAERQFDAAKVPQDARRNYYQEFHRYIYGE